MHPHSDSDDDDKTARTKGVAHKTTLFVDLSHPLSLSVFVFASSTGSFFRRHSSHLFSLPPTQSGLLGFACVLVLLRARARAVVALFLCSCCSLPRPVLTVYGLHFRPNVEHARAPAVMCNTKKHLFTTKRKKNERPPKCVARATARRLSAPQPHMTTQSYASTRMVTYMATMTISAT